MKSFLKEFKAFALKGNVFDMAVGVMIASAFGKIVTSIVEDLVMPLISILTGGINFADWFVALDGNTYATVAEAKEAGAAVLTYGNFFAVVLNFLIIALCIFLLVKLVNKTKKPEAAPAPVKAPRLCDYCRSEIADDATKCPHCCSVLEIKE